MPHRSSLVEADPPQPSFETLMRTIPHEVGHVLVGPGHPDELKTKRYGGEAPLPGTDFSRRLMVSGPAAGPNPGDLLVKKEWDEAESWLKLRVDQPIPNQ